MRRARPTNALGGTPTKDHLFGEDKRALCGSWLYGGGRTVDPEADRETLAQAVKDGDLCARCARKAGVVPVTDGGAVAGHEAASVTPPIEAVAHITLDGTPITLLPVEANATLGVHVEERDDTDSWGEFGDADAPPAEDESEVPDDAQAEVPISATSWVTLTVNGDRRAKVGARSGATLRVHMSEPRADDPEELAPDGGTVEDEFDLDYSTGDLVRDRDDDPDEAGTMVVLRYLRNDDGEPTMAATHEIPSLGESVAEVNPEYDPAEWVVEVAFEGWLDSTVPEWRGLLTDARDLPDSATFYDLLGEYASEWGVPKRTYTYPEGRLVPRRFCPDHEVRGERIEPFPEAGEPGGWACPVERCGYGTLPANDAALDALDEREVEDGEVSES